MNNTSNTLQLTKQALNVSLIAAASLILLALRVKLMHSFFYLFMGWNLFLALVPYGITWFLSTRKDHLRTIPYWRKLLVLSLSLALWLLFLPNAPYMLTDFIHFNWQSRVWVLDLLLLAGFSITGYYVFFLSIELWFEELLPLIHFKMKKWRNSIHLILFFLAAIGVYLGRTLRYNSWDFWNNPLPIAADIYQLFINPTVHVDDWMLIIFLFLTLVIGQMLFKTFRLHVGKKK